MKREKVPLPLYGADSVKERRFYLMSNSSGASEPREPESESGLEIDRSSAGETVFTRSMTMDNFGSPALSFGTRFLTSPG